MNPGYGLGVGIACAPLNSAPLPDLGRGGRVLHRSTHTHREAH